MPINELYNLYNYYDRMETASVIVLVMAGLAAFFLIFAGILEDGPMPRAWKITLALVLALFVAGAAYMIWGTDQDTFLEANASPEVLARVDDWRSITRYIQHEHGGASKVLRNVMVGKKEPIMWRTTEKER
jgi:glucan phosphoethanolaminetransferase (alkaline phosphatase superfamily)